ncbi:MAG: hypothetical protein AB1750_16575, partial [Chloroflexota bacterium]
FGTEGIITDSQLTRPRTDPSAAAASATVSGKSSKKNLVWIGAGAGAVILLVAAFLLFGAPASGPAAEASPTVASPTAAAATLPPPTMTIPAEPPTQPPPPTQPLPPGNADSFAFVSANEIWLMNFDGSNAGAITSDGSAKRNLQWLPDGKTLIYIQNTCLYSIDVTVRQPQKITCLQAESVDAFRVSPDGKRVAVSIDLQLVIAPFDMAALARAQDRFDLAKIEDACLYNRESIKDVRWSNDSQRVAAVYLDVSNQPMDQIRVMDVSGCPPSQPASQGTFPGSSFVIAGFQNRPIFPGFDWDGESALVFNDLVRNDGFGNLYYFDAKTGEGKMFNPIENACCYRDARFSPDGKFLLFAFQDERAGAQSVIHMVYAPLDMLLTGRGAPPLALPAGTLKDPRSAPQPALHPAGPPPP